jgi:sec-independent protein translocase protein TatC
VASQESPVNPVSNADEASMPLLDHVRELRVRLLRAVLAVAVGFALSYAFADYLFAWLTLPLREVAHGKLLLIGTGVAEAFYTKIKVSLMAGVFIASPAVFYEIWKFIAPGLYRSEKRMALPFVICASMFFVLGGYFCWAVVFKIGYAFFLGQYSSIGVTPTIRISEYLAFSAKLMFAFGLTFEMPIFALFLTRVGMVDHRLMMHYFRYAVLIIFVVAAILAPPDMVSMLLLAFPLLALYILSIGVSYMFRAESAPSESAAAPPAS